MGLAIGQEHFILRYEDPGARTVTIIPVNWNASQTQKKLLAAPPCKEYHGEVLMIGQLAKLNLVDSRLNIPCSFQLSSSLFLLLKSNHFRSLHALVKRTCLGIVAVLLSSLS